MNQVQILFLSSLPREQLRLNVGTELRRIEHALGGRFQVEERSSLRRTDMIKLLLARKRHIVHFSGHGNDDDHLMLEAEDGHAEPVRTDDLVTWFAAVPRDLKPDLVVFSACYSAVHAKAIAEVIGCAVGVRAGIRDSTSFDFATGFYAALGSGLSVGAAVRSGNATVSSTVSKEERLVVHSRADTDADALHFRAPEPVLEFPPDLHMDRTRQLALFADMLADGGTRLMTVTADGNMGKSSLITAMARSTAQPCAVMDLAGRIATPDDVLSWLATSLGVSWFEWIADIGQPAYQAALAEATRTFLAAARDQAATSGRMAVLFDSVHAATGDLTAWLAKMFFPSLLAGGSDAVVCVAAGRHLPAIQVQPHLVHSEKLGNFQASDIREVLRSLGLDDSDTAVRLVLAGGDGHPYYTRMQLAKALRQGARA